MKLLLTGFEPFHNYKTNPSMDIAKKLDKKVINCFEINSAIIPVSID